MSLIATLDATALRDSTKLALICRERSLNYQEFTRRTCALAGWLLDQGLVAGDRVSVHWNNEIETAEIILACFRAGLVAVPVNARFKPAEAGYVIHHAGARMCFTAPHLRGVHEGARAEYPSIPETRTAIPELLDAPSQLPKPDAAAPALIQYTSGTTARPKGATHSHNTILASAHHMRSTGLDGDSVVVIPTPIMHSSGLTATLLPALLSGATVVLIPAFTPAAVLDAIAQHRGTYCATLPAMLQLMVVEQERLPRDMSSMKHWICGGDALPVALQDRARLAFGGEAQEGLAMTEYITISCNLRDAIRPGTMGPPLSGVEVQILSSSRQPMLEGQTGELAIRGPALTLGYWNQPEAMAAAMHDGWFLTGDLAHRDADGYLRFDGRCKEIIIRDGSNISPQEVEEALYQHSSVLEVGVVGLPDSVHGEKVVAFVALRGGASVAESDLLAHARQRIADYKLPSHVIFLDTLPKSITGKVQRRALKENAPGLTAS